MSQQGCNGALRKAQVHRESHVGGAKELVGEFGQCRRQALPPEFRRDGYPGPAAFNDLSASFLETFGSRYAAIGPALAAFFVANAIEWCQHFLAELCCFAQHRFHHVGRGVGETRKIAVMIKMKDVVEQEQRIVDWRLIDRHDLSPQQECRKVLLDEEARVSPTRTGPNTVACAQATAVRQYDVAGLHLC